MNPTSFCPSLDGRIQVKRGGGARPFPCFAVFTRKVEGNEMTILKEMKLN